MMPAIPATNGHDDWSNSGATRAIHVTMIRAEVEALCAKHKMTISAIETLPRGGTRVVMMNGNDVAAMRTVFGKTLIEGKVEREHWATVRR